jgi:hypothetical protein
MTLTARLCGDFPGRRELVAANRSRESSKIGEVEPTEHDPGLYLLVMPRRSRARIHEG